MIAVEDRDAVLADLTALRRDLHQHPELMYETHRTAALIAERLRAAGCDQVVEGIGRTGVVGVIEGSRGPGRSIGLRADMDALPIHEETNLAYASRSPGKMHACGHDGHVTMLIGAAEALARARDFRGRVVVIFQPAEEGGAGAKAMIEEGLFERFPCAEVYALHNRPGLPLGQFAATAGAAMASVDELRIEITGRGGHAAFPHEAVDPLVVAAAVIQALQSVVSRSIDPLQSAVVSLTTIAGGDAFNVIPQSVRIGGTVRTLNERVRDRIEARVKALVECIADAHEASAEVRYIRHYPVTVNHAAETAFAVTVTEEIVGKEAVNAQLPPSMGGEDFAFMLEGVPGAILWVGNGASAGLHHPAYDFNDAAIGHGVEFFRKLVLARC